MSRSFATVVRLSMMEAAASINLTNVFISFPVNVFIIQENPSGPYGRERESKLQQKTKF